MIFSHLFEKAAIEKFIDQHSKCPITDQPLSKEDLIEVNGKSMDEVVGTGSQPRSATESSVPGLVTMVQSRWDGLMLEVGALKQNLGVTRKELSQALYQYEAACRVVARLIKERDQAREELVKLKGIKESENKEEAQGIDEDLKKKFDELSDILANSRRLHKPPADLTSDEALAAFKENSFANVHTGKVTSLELSHNYSSILTGGKDCTAKIYDLDKRSVVATLEHTAKVTALAFLNSSNAITCTSDGAARSWEVGADKAKPLHTFNAHTKSITACAPHPDTQHCLFFSKDGSWSLHNTATSQTLQHVQTKDRTPITNGALHPDGLMLSAGLHSGTVMFWDVRAQDAHFSLEAYKGAVKGVCYSQRGHQMVTLGKGESGVLLWDLRKLGAEELARIEGSREVKGTAFDPYGVCVGMCGSVVEVYKMQGKNRVVSVGEGKFTQLRFGSRNSFIVAGTNDGLLKIFK